MAERRVAITGIGVVTPAGLGREAFWQAVLAREPHVRTIDLFDASSFACRVAGQLHDFSARPFVPKNYRKAVKVMARDIEIAVAAADLAFRDAGIATTGTSEGAASDVDPKRLGCNIGAGLICTDLNELGVAVNTAVVDGKFNLHAWGREGMNNLTPLWLLKYLPNMLACHVTIIHDAEGPSNTITCGDASGYLAVGEATRLVARGGADVVVAGGAESKLNPMGLLRQGLLQRLNNDDNDDPPHACRPFADARGTVIGEGSGLMILEDLDRAEARGARIYAEVVGFGAACDPEGVQITRPTAGGLDLAVSKALADAGIGSDEVDLIAAHGTGVPGEDDGERQAWRSALGERASDIPAFALTGAIGSLFAGHGTVSLAAAALALHDQTVPPTLTGKDVVGLNLAAEPRKKKLTYAVGGAFTVGGQSGACVLKRYVS